jgi:DNA replication protein DnaC
MNRQVADLQEATIKAQCKMLRMPMIASQFSSLADEAIREKKSHIGYREALLLAELEERERNTIERRIRDAHLPRMKTLEEFDYTQSPNVTAAKMRDLAEGGYIERADRRAWDTSPDDDRWLAVVDNGTEGNPQSLTTELRKPNPCLT